MLAAHSASAAVHTPPTARPGQRLGAGGGGGSVAVAAVPPPRRRRGAAVSTAALPPANEIAGFIIGGGLVGLVFAASKLDGAIAKAQVRGFEVKQQKGGAWKVEKPKKGDGNIFIVPDDDEPKGRR
mmetsp:Transcript_15807/g.38492  ORF Transcript_15807/g.38492 Transcript_15807/m.38492 type:complete len:126 (-) Transcript_15807:131-508(-)